MTTCVCIFQPSVKVISAITNANPAAITTTDTHSYMDGMIVRIIVPQACGMRQMDNKSGTITCTGTNTFTINIDSTRFDVFSVPVLPDHNIDTVSLVIPIGEVASTTLGATHNTL